MLFNIERELFIIQYPIKNKMATSGFFLFFYTYFDKIIGILLTVIKVITI